MPDWTFTDQKSLALSAVIDLQHHEELFKSVPPPFGHGLHQFFGFDPEYINLNHGSYGSLPNLVREAADKLTTLVESNPDKFIRLTSLPLLIHVRERLAKFIGAKTDEVVLVPNASHGINTVLKNFEWQQGDILIDATTTYNSIMKTLQYISDTSPHPQVSEFKLELPTTHAQIISSFRDHLRSLPRQSNSPNSPQKIVAVIDSIASNPGVLLPWREMINICREEGVWSVVDAAHSIGQELNIDVGASGCDFWITNCHKWLLAQRSCAILYVPKRNQHLIKSAFPTPYTYVSPFDENFPRFVLQFEWTGTIDVVPYLTIGTALDFRQWLGGEEKINSYCHSIALEGGKRLAEILGTEVMHGKDEDELTLNMVNVRLPIPSQIKYSWAIDQTLRDQLLNGWNTYVAHFPHNGKIWVRCSAQVWSEVSDFEHAGKALKAVCKEIVEAHGEQKP